MKTNYLPRNKPHSSKWRKVVIALVTFVVVIYLLSLVRVPLVSMVAPLWRAEDAGLRGFANAFSFLTSRDTLIKENAELKLRVQSYEAERFAYAGWQEREAEFLELLGRQKEFGGIAAAVIAHPPQSPYDVLIIDAGESDGVTTGQSVRMPEGPVLGYIIGVSPRSAKVKLFSSSSEKTNAVLERDGSAVVLEGAGSGMFRFSLPRDAHVEPGDRVLSAGIEASTLAVVGDVILKPTDSFKEVLARGPANIFDIRFVLVSR